MKEIWCDVYGYEGLYQVSNLGNVKSLLNNIYLKGHVSNCGYCDVQLYKDKKVRVFKVHRLVALHFIPNPGFKQQVNHIDGNKLNNNVTNLEWVTAKENTEHAIVNGFRKAHVKETHKRLPRKILQYDNDGYYLKTWDSVKEIVRFYGYSSSAINSCVSGNSHSSYGYIWKPYSENFPRKIESLETIYKRNQRIQKGVPKKYFQIDQFTKSGQFIQRWNSLDEICSINNYQRTHVTKSLNGQRKSAYGFVWKNVAIE